MGVSGATAKVGVEMGGRADWSARDDHRSHFERDGATTPECRRDPDVHRLTCGDIGVQRLVREHSALILIRAVEGVSKVVRSEDLEL